MSLFDSISPTALTAANLASATPVTLSQNTLGQLTTTPAASAPNMLSSFATPAVSPFDLTGTGAMMNCPCMPGTTMAAVPATTDTSGAVAATPATGGLDLSSILTAVENAVSQFISTLQSILGGAGSTTTTPATTTTATPATTTTTNPVSTMSTIDPLSLAQTNQTPLSLLPTASTLTAPTLASPTFAAPALAPALTGFPTLTTPPADGDGRAPGQMDASGHIG